MNTSVEEIAVNGFQVRLSDYLSQGWELIKGQLGIFIAFNLVFGLLAGIVALIPCLGIFVFLLVPFFTGGYMVALREADLGNKVTLETFLSVRQSSIYGQLLVQSIVHGLLVLFGLLCCGIPGLYLIIAYTFAVPFLVFEYNNDFWLAMESSRKVISANWFGIFGLTLVINLITSLLGQLTCCIGFLVLIPWNYAVIYCAYKDIVGITDEDNEFKVTDHLLSEEN
jgi:uncharacterized membrane protein